MLPKLTFLFLSMFAQLVLAQAPVISRAANSYDLNVQFNMVNISAPEGSLSGLDFGLSAGIPLKPKWGLTVSGRQGFESGGQSLYSAIGAGVAYAPWGDLRKQSTRYLLDGRAVAETQGVTTSRLILTLNARQYFFNGSENVVPFTGLAVNASFPVVRLWGVILRGQADYAQMANGDLDATVVAFGLGMEI